MRSILGALAPLLATFLLFGCGRSATLESQSDEEARPAHDGLWHARDSAGHDLWFLVQADSLRWVDFVHSIDAECDFTGQDEGLRLDRARFYDQLLVVDGKLAERARRAEFNWRGSTEIDVDLAIAGGEARGSFRASALCGEKTRSIVARRADPADIEASLLSRRDRIRGGEIDPPARPLDGVWRGATSEGKAFEMLVLANSVQRLHTDHGVPKSCAFAGSADEKVDGSFWNAYRGRIAGGAFDLQATQEGQRIEALRLTGELAGGVGKGDLRFEMTSAPGTYGPKCDHDLEVTWTAQRVDAAQVRDQLKLSERFELGERFELVEKVEVGRVTGDSCDIIAFEAAVTPDRIPSEAALAFRISMDSATYGLVEDVEWSVSGPGRPLMETSLACTSSGTGKQPETVVVQRLNGGAPFPPGRYRLDIRVNGERKPSVQSEFEVVR